MGGAVNLVAREMCNECDALLGKSHKEGCSKRPGVVQKSDAVEKFTTVERVEQEDPLIGLDADTAELIIEALPDPEDPEVPEDWSPDEAPERADKLKALREGLAGFVAGARELEGEDQ